MAGIRKYTLIGLLGAMLYCAIEVAWRGYSHWTMALTGGVCFAVIYAISQTKLPYIQKSILGASVITLIEFGVGIIVNVILKMDVWDYSPQPFNLLGQICPLYSLFWFLLCLVSIPLCKKLNRPFDYFFSGIIG